eukprot:g8684.t1 g8684   contig30:54728-55251(-)
MILVLTIDDGMEPGWPDGTDEGFGFDDKEGTAEEEKTMEYWKGLNSVGSTGCLRAAVDNMTSMKEAAR